MGVQEECLEGREQRDIDDNQPQEIVEQIQIAPQKVERNET